MRFDTAECAATEVTGERGRQTHPVPTVYLRTVSRTFELSFRSSLQLSLMVRVRYRSRTR